MWLPILSKFKEAAKIHSGRNLSIRGKAVILNTSVMSKIWYSGKFVHLPPALLDDFIEVMKDFIWQGSQLGKVRREILELHPDNGGVGLSNIDDKLRAFRIMHVIDFLIGPEKSWSGLASYWLSMPLREHMAGRFDNNMPHSEVLPFISFVSASLNLS